MADPIIYTFRADGAQQVANAIKANNDALRAAEKATREAARASDALFKTNAALTKQRVSEEFKRQAAAAKEVAKAEREAQKAAEQLFRTNAALSKQRLSEEFKRQAQAARDLAEAQQLAGNGATTLAATLSLAGGAFIKSAIDARVEYEGLSAAINSATQGQGAESLEFLNREVDRLRLNLPAATNAFTQLSAAARGTTLQGQGVEEIFSAIAQAGRVNNLSLEKQEKAYLAITQVISKGVVQQEELRGQLSEALPGAVQIFARALNVSTAELGKLIQAGEVGLPELLKFAQQLESETAGSVEAATQTLGASFDQLSTEVNRFQVATGEALSPLAKGLADTASATLNSFNELNPAFQKAILLTGGLVTAFTLLIAAQIANNTLNITGTALETARAIATRASAIATTALATAQGLLAVATGTATAAQTAQIATLARGAAQAGLFAAALGAIALNVATVNNATGASLELNQAIEEGTAAMNRFREAQAQATAGTAEGFANATDAVNANRKAIEDSIPIYLKAADLLINAIDFLDPADITSNAEAAVSAQAAAFSELTSQIENDTLAAFDRLANAPGGLAAATDAELSALIDAVDTYTAALEESTPVEEEDLKRKAEYIATLGEVKAELDAVTAATGDGTDAIEDQAKALKQFREDAKRALQEQRDEQNLELDRQREDEGIAQDRARADELAAIARQNAEEIAAIEDRNSEANAARERANAEEIAALQEQNAAQIAEQQRVAQEQEGQLEQQQQDELQRREDAFNRSQELAAQQFQDNLQADQEAFNQRQNEARQAFEEGQSGQQTDIDRQLQLEFATDDEERARLEAAFEREDAIAKRRAELEAPLLAAREAFEKKQQAEQVAFEEQQRVAEAVFNKSQQLAQSQFDTAQLALKTAQEAQLQALRVANEGILAGIRQQQEVDLLAVKVAQENELKAIREQQERDLQAIRDEQQTTAQNEQRAFEDAQREADRAFADSQRESERAFKEQMRSLDEQSADRIAATLSSAGLSTPAPIPGRRTGGSVEGSSPYIVGEAGPELFVPKQSGYVLNRSDTLRVAAQQYQPPSIRMPTPVSAPQNVRGSDRALLQEVAGLRKDLKSFSRPEQTININEPEDTMQRRLYQVVRAGLI